MTFLLKASVSVPQQGRGLVGRFRKRDAYVRPLRKSVKMSISAMCSSEGLSVIPKQTGLPVIVNSAAGKMGKAVIESAVSAGLHILPVSFAQEELSRQFLQVCGKEFQIYGPSERENVLVDMYDQFPDLIVVDYTVPTAVNDNAELYCKIGVPFVMGTAGGDRERLYKTVGDSKVYSVISLQMGKQVVAFLAAMEIMAKQFPGALAGYSLEVSESHQAAKKDTSGTAKAVLSCFQKLGVDFDMSHIQLVRDPQQQMMIGVPEEYLSGRAFHLYHQTSPDKAASFEFQHNVCSRSTYAEGTVDAVTFLAKKVKAKEEKHIYDMTDVIREGSMR